MLVATRPNLAIVDAPSVGVHALQRDPPQVGPKLLCTRLERQLPSKLSLVGECRVVPDL